jgi:hypothetical protein
VLERAGSWLFVLRYEAHALVRVVNLQLQFRNAQELLFVRCGFVSIGFDSLAELSSFALDGLYF